MDIVQEGKENHPHHEERAFSVKDYNPWKNIVKWETCTRGKKTATTTREEYEKSHKGSSPPKEER
ncbi:hypothetical protein QQS21_002039 [Conoideocrella luteorostrata]|uniref:Uncharacterized protein n=1 Tax=Conoideocrella luteorostrata TaxID=1105319 RepID=A0AAJ0CYZ9_9HYPO|nr:hypothetical protein QQS21_002039 [Conoideocrella luteorostrata]